MSIAPQLRQFLDQSKVEYDIIEHRPTKSAMETARSCDIPAERLAKAVLLDTDDEDHLLLVWVLVEGVALAGGEGDVDDGQGLRAGRRRVREPAELAPVEDLGRDLGADGELAGHWGLGHGALLIGRSP